MTKEETAKKYFSLATKIQNEKQFNKKVDLNGELQKFKRDNALEAKTNDPTITIYISGKKVATIRKQYASKKTNGSYKELKKKILIMV